ncbi:MAG: glycosyltransferase involved in cell wall biosynthesis [Acidimicrobiales bacterium]|jgi:glycosyltransferase involved in cell wall biosynthesis
MEKQRGYPLSQTNVHNLYSAMDTQDNKIQCSVGILTYNSEKTLHRTLESIKDFSNIIISDGGSTDDTLAIAKEYGCIVIEQYAKQHPGTDPSHPIANFARERNLMILQATENWFFWLDSDEYISTELHAEISEVCTQEIPEFYAYYIPIVHQSPDAQVTYRSWKQVHQIRFFNLTTGGRFERKIHEMFVFDKQKYPVGMLNGAWFVPISKINFPEYKKAVNYRLGIMFLDSVLDSPRMYVLKALYRPLKGTVGILYREMRLRLRYSGKELIPLRYTRNRLYSQWVTFKIVTQLYFSKGK